MRLIQHLLKPRTFVFVFLACIQQSAAASEPLLHHSQVFLNSLATEVYVQAPRLGLSALHTFLAHPSLLQQWGIIAPDAIATYNSITNTLVLQPSMTIDDKEFGGARLSSLQEIRTVTGAPARVSAGVIFHELSHAEFDFYVEEDAETYDAELMNAIRAEMPALVASNNLSAIKAAALPSEIFAYYREELIMMLLTDAAEIKLASGLEPDLNTCTFVRTIPNNARNFSPTGMPYSTRVDLRTVWVGGSEVKLDVDKAIGERLNRALAKHAEATMTFPQSRAELLKRIRSDKEIRKAMAICREKRLKA